VSDELKPQAEFAFLYGKYSRWRARRAALDIEVAGPVASFLMPDDPDRREAALASRLDRFTRPRERLQCELTILVEALALAVRCWPTLIRSLPESAQAAAQAKGR
jgi:hypothetical protein